MAERLGWGILGAGRIAGAFAKGVAASTTGRLVAVGSRSGEKAEKFGQEYDVPKRYGTYEAMLADADVQAVYVATPHPQHAQWAIAAMRAGKHVLIEKPVALNAAQAGVIFETARVHRVFAMEAYMYRCHPQIKKLAELLRANTVGEVRFVQASFSFQAGFNEESRLFNNDLGGGGILDVGGYAVSMCRLVAGAAAGKDFAEPVEVKGAGVVGKTGVDEWAAATLKFAGGIIAQVATGVRLNLENTVKIYGSEGRIVLNDPWRSQAGAATIEIHRHGKPVEALTVESAVDMYATEADAVGANVAKGQAPDMSWEDSMGNMRTLDAWRAAIGQAYEQEKAEHFQPVPPRKVAPLAGNNMKYGEIAGVGKKVSRLVLGADFASNDAREFYTYADAFFECGGNAFDTSHWYGNADRHVGLWMKTRGVREKTVVLGKGAHTPYCTPEFMDKQLKESAAHFDGYVDVYAMHRDNPDVPVGEFVDLLNRHHKEGRVKAFGAGNWSLERLRAANAYADQKGLVPFTVLSNQFSLARMISPVWGGCISASDPAYRAYLAERQISLMPWSSQARGFFADGRAAPDKRTDEELVRCWYGDDNFQRLERVRQLAKKRGVLAINVGLAWVLAQPFPTFPLIGPRKLVELATTLPGLDIQLTPDEVKWLNLEA